MKKLTIQQVKKLLVSLHRIIAKIYSSEKSKKKNQENSSEEEMDKTIDNTHNGNSSKAKGNKLEDMVNKIIKDFYLSPTVLNNIVDGFVSEFKRGLEGNGSDFPMIPTYITKRADGTEKGEYLAIDLGGSNVRVCLVKLTGEYKDMEFINEKYVISEELKVAHVSELFNFIAEKLEVLVKANNLDLTSKEPFPLGFTFSFPIKQTALDKGSLIMWNKGFQCSGAIDEDVVQLMQEAIDKRKLNVKIKAIVNDTAGTLLSSGIHHPNTLTGVILGTSTNAAYYEKVSNIKKLENHDAKEMIINIEWGNFDTKKKVVPCTTFDHRLDRETQNPYVMVFEKMVSGKYLGEIARLCLLHLIDHRVLFKGKSTEKLNTPYEFLTSYMSIIESDNDVELSKTKEVLEDYIGLPKDSTTLEERLAIKNIFGAIAERAASMSAAGIAALCKERIDLVKNGPVTIGIDGSLYKHYPSFAKHIKQSLFQILGSEISDNIKLQLAEDGSGIGAALAAMLAAK